MYASRGFIQKVTYQVLIIRRKNPNSSFSFIQHLVSGYQMHGASKEFVQKVTYQVLIIRSKNPNNSFSFIQHLIAGYQMHGAAFGNRHKPFF